MTELQTTKRPEIRRNEDGTLDEVVACGASFCHLEQLNDNSWWLCIEQDGVTVHVNLTARGKIKGRAHYD